MYIKYIHKQGPNNNGLKRIIQRYVLMHPYHFKEHCIQVATMFIFRININRNQNFSITLLTSQLVKIKTVIRLIQIQVYNYISRQASKGLFRSLYRRSEKKNDNRNRSETNLTGNLLTSINSHNKRYERVDGHATTII